MPEVSPTIGVCSHCGTTNQLTASFCQSCGKNLNSIENAVPEAVKISRSRKRLSLPTLLKRLIRRIRALFKNPVVFNEPMIQDVSLFSRDFSKYKLAVPLKQTFRFAHEPIHTEGEMPFIGRQAELNAFVERILFSNGGSFLLTGYRGVGKTSFVNQTIAALEQHLPWAEAYLGKTEILAVHLNMARPLQPSELMHHIIRRLYDKLLEKNIFSSLSPQLQEQLTLAYQRTSVNMTRTIADGREGNIGLSELTIEAGTLKTTVKPSMGYKQTHSRNYQSAFLGYDDKAAEYDVIEISRRLSAGYLKQSASLRSSKQRLIRLKIIFVFDEMDKLEEFSVETNGSKQLFIDHLLSHLKNLFTTSGISFIFVAGKDLHERWLDDLGRGDSIYESVFSYDKYLPCMWADVHQICDALIDNSALVDRPNSKPTHCGQCDTPAISGQLFCHQCNTYLRDASATRSLFEDFKKYLSYRGRGLPRRIIRGFNEYVQWNHQRPILVFTPQDIRRIRFYAGLQDVLETNLPKLLGTVTEEAIGSQGDKQRLGIYYLIDWMIQRGQRSFSLTDVIRASKQLSQKVALAEEVAPRFLSEVIELLIKHQYLTQVTVLNQAQVIDVNAEPEKLYQIPLRRLHEIAGAVDIFEEEAIALAWDKDIAFQIARYEIHELIGTGGSATVYRAWDTQLHQEVALKLLNSMFLAEAPKLLKREAEILRLLKHPNIVRCYDSGEVDGQFYFAMQYMDGLDLNVILHKQGRIDPDVTIHLFLPLLNAWQYIHEQGIVRLDIKPGNIMLNRNGEVYLIDLGIAKWKQIGSNTQVEAANDTIAFVVAGTPLYAAPEQMLSAQSVDERTDIYAVGVTLYEVITGRHPFRDNSNLRDAPIPPSQLITLSPTLEEIILKCLAPQPELRFQSMQELASALKNAATREIGREALVSIIGTAFQGVEQEGRASTTAISIIGSAKSTGFAPNLPKITWTDDAALKGPPTIIQGDSDTIETSDTIIDLPGGSLDRDSSGQLEALSPNSHVNRAFLKLFPEGKTYRLGESETTLGRDSSNSIRLDHSRVSRFHARILMEKDCYYIEDLNSIRGTKVNGTLIQGRHELQNQDQIQIAQFVFEFRLLAFQIISSDDVW